MGEFRRYKSKPTSTFMEDRGVLGDDKALWGIYHRAKQARDRQEASVMEVRVAIAVEKQWIWDEQWKRMLEPSFEKCERQKAEARRRA